MSRYVIWTNDENLEVFVGFDEGMGGFFLTIADSRTCTGETGSYLFHNLDHHPVAQMKLDEVTATLARFGLTLPSDLALQLAADARMVSLAIDASELPGSFTTKVTGWQSAT